MRKTKKQKIKLMLELSPYFGEQYTGENREGFMESWLEAVKEYDSLEELLRAEGHDDAREHHLRTLWDVHTEIAFSPLYRLL